MENRMMTQRGLKGGRLTMGNKKNKKGQHARGGSTPAREREVSSSPGEFIDMRGIFMYTLCRMAAIILLRSMRIFLEKTCHPFFLISIITKQIN
jgi:hypothetical protein